MNELARQFKCHRTAISQKLKSAGIKLHGVPASKKQVVLREMKRVLKPYGRVIIADPWVPNPIKFVTNLLLALINSEDVKMYSWDEMTEILENSGFASINVEITRKFFFIATATSKKPVAL
jgi:SAM-dependent methyltransferase